jgi:hypothetical protein
MDPLAKQMCGAKYHAQHIVDMATAIYWLSSLADYKARALRKGIDEDFAKLAAELGYRIEKIEEKPAEQYERDEDGIVWVKEAS